MSLLGKIIGVGKAIDKTILSATGADPREIIKVVKDIEDAGKVAGSFAKDVGTSATRIATDTALDVIDVGADLVGQPTDFPENAKRKMSEAGVITAGEAIEKNHYGFLKQREADAQAKYNNLVSLDNQIKATAEMGDQRADIYEKMLSDVAILAQMTIEAQTEFDKITQLPDWEQWAQMLDLPLSEMHNIDKYTTQWEKVGKSLALSNAVTGLTDGVTGLSAIAVAAKAAKLSRLGKAAKAAKFVKIGKLLGKASGILTVVAIGLDVGLSVAELEAKAAKLNQHLDELNAGIKEAQENLADLQSETQQINAAIEALLHNVSPKQSEVTWETWFEDKKIKLTTLRTQLIDLNTIRQTALETARSTKSYPHEFRIQFITSLDPDITEEEAQSILAIVDREMN